MNSCIWQANGKISCDLTQVDQDNLKTRLRTLYSKYGDEYEDDDIPTNVVIYNNIEEFSQYEHHYSPFSREYLLNDFYPHPNTYGTYFKYNSRPHKLNLRTYVREYEPGRVHHLYPYISATRYTRF